MAMEKNGTVASDGSIGVADADAFRRRKFVNFRDDLTSGNGKTPHNQPQHNRLAGTLTRHLHASDEESSSKSNQRTDVVSETSDSLFEVPDSAMNKTFYDLRRDLIQLQNRVMELNERMSNDPEMPPLINDLKSQIENLRNKLEAFEVYSLTERPLNLRKSSDAQLHAVFLKFQNIWDQPVSRQTAYNLIFPTFDTAGYTDEDMLLFLQHMFIEFKLMETFNIPLPVLRNFLYEVYKNYNNVPFHNFRHCFCVAQMMYSIIWHTDLHRKLGDLDILILLVSCICHDLDHPGFNNIYQINARTELALRYNDISPLENHHCSVAFRILKNSQCNIFANLDKETFKEFREGIIRCILATDMARHNEILAQFKEIASEFDFDNRTHRNLLSMVLIKVADISNEARPLDVAEPWLDRLLTEFFQQSDLEKSQGLPVTPFMDREKITKPSSQCSFIGFVLLPLFEALGELFPELESIIIDPAKAALEHYRKLNEAAKDERLRRKSVIENGDIGDGSGGAGGDVDQQAEQSHGPQQQMVKSSSGLSAGKRSLGGSSGGQSRQRSKSSCEGSAEASPPVSPVSILFENDAYEDNVNENDRDRDEDDEEVTATEVECSEKTVKFKISTETATPGRNTCPNSRKGSREKCQIEKDCQVVNCRPDVASDNRRKSFAVLETRLKEVDHIKMGKKRRSSIRAMDSIEVDPTSWQTPTVEPPTSPPPTSTTNPIAPRLCHNTAEHAIRRTSDTSDTTTTPPLDKPTLMAKLRSLKEKLHWTDKAEDTVEESNRPNSLPTRKSGGEKM